MKRFKKTAATLLMLILCSALLSGCGSLQLSQRDIVDAVSIDYAKDGYTVCVAAFNITQEEAGYKLYTERAQTLPEAFEALNSHTLSALMYENNAVVFLGVDAYRYRYAETIDYLTHGYRGSMSTQIIGVATEARTALERIVGQDGSFSQLVANLSDQKLQDRSSSNELYQCVPDRSGNISGAFLPVVELRECPQGAGEPTRTELILSCVAVINERGWIEDISGELMEGVLILQGKVQRIPVTLRIGDSAAQASLQKPTVRLFRDESRPQTLRVRCTAEFQLPNAAAQLGDRALQSAKAQNEQYLTALLAQTVYHCRSNYDIDLLHLEQYSYLLQQKPQGIYPTLVFETDIQ